jgi:hypothetical protein
MEERTCCKRANSKANQSSKQLLVEDLIHEGQYTDTQQRAQTDYCNEQETQSPHWQQKIDHMLLPLLRVSKYQKSPQWFPLSPLPFPMLNTQCFKTLFQQSLFYNIFQSFYMVLQFTILHCIVILLIIMMISDTVTTSPRILVLIYTPVPTCYENREDLLLYPLLILGLFTFSNYKLK